MLRRIKSPTCRHQLLKSIKFNRVVVDGQRSRSLSRARVGRGGGCRSLKRFWTSRTWTRFFIRLRQNAENRPEFDFNAGPPYRSDDKLDRLSPRKTFWVSLENGRIYFGWTGWLTLSPPGRLWLLEVQRAWNFEPEPSLSFLNKAQAKPKPVLISLQVICELWYT